jgi:hypothetical protein
MKISFILASLVGMFLLLSPLQVSPSLGQIFTIEAPEAPEFDSEGNLVQDGNQGNVPAPAAVDTTRAPKAPEIRQPSTRSRPQRRGSRTPARAPRQARQQPARAPARTDQSQGMRPVGGPPGPTASPAQAQRPDCSRYPMLIIRARSQQEMQHTARLFLTCLLESGWPMKKAKEHVVRSVKNYEMMHR